MGKELPNEIEQMGILELTIEMALMRIGDKVSNCECRFQRFS